MEYKLILEKREKLKKEIDALKISSLDINDKETSITLNQKIAALKEQYQFYNAMLRVNNLVKRSEDDENTN